MDPNLIYVKTAAGENAIQQRTRVIQRNVRMILILVDGQSSVDDLSRKTGNPQLTENALAELEKGGFIEPKVEQHDSLWEESKRVAQEIRSAAIEKAVQLSSSEKREHYPDFNQGPPAARSIPDFDGRMSDVPISLHSMFDAKDDGAFSTSQFSIAPDEPALRRFSVPAREPMVSPTRTAPRKKKKAAGAPKPSIFAQLRSLWASADRDLEEEPVKIEPLRRASRRSLGWPLRTLFLLVGIALLGALAVVFFPLSLYLPDVEAAFSNAVGRPITVGMMRVGVSPVPELILEDVKVGEGNDAIRIREIHLQPELTSVLSQHKSFRKAVVRGAELRMERVAAMPSIFSSLADPRSIVSIGAIRFENAQVSFNAIVLDDAEAEVKLDSNGKMQSLSVRSADKRLSMIVTPTSGGAELTAEAFGWRPSEGSKYVIDSVNFNGKLNNDTLAISNLEMRIFDGLIRGEAVVRGAGTAPNLAGNMSFERINASKFGDALGVGKRLAGDAAGKMRFSAHSNAWPTVLSAISAEGEFSVQRGNISGIDLAEAIRRASGTPVQGGVTAFEQLSGRMKLAPEKSQFIGMTMNSGLMQSTGYLDIGKDLKLAGRLEVQMRGSVNQTRVPVSINGTLDSPKVQVVGR